MNLHHMLGTRRRIVLFSAAGLLVVAGAGTAAAVSLTGGDPSAPASSAPASASSPAGPEQSARAGRPTSEPGKVVSSIRVDENALEALTDTQEAQRLVSVSKVDLARASSAATGAVGGGEVVDAELDQEKGNVVWETDVLAHDGSLHEILVDAGNARILSSRPETDDD